jgi:trimeric autotransporter adhesin
MHQARSGRFIYSVFNVSGDPSMLHKNEKGRFALASLMSVLTAMSSTLAYAGPIGGQVVGGTATIDGGSSGTVINQVTSRAIINWQDFSIGSGELVRFVQPDAASATLNRVLGGAPSSLLGTLEANGRVFIINPNGVLVGAGARIDTAGFLASTLDVSDSSFLSGGDLLFSGDSTAAIQNLGSINALGGDVFLIARKVENAGTITAANGTAGLAAGSEVLLTTGGNERVFIRAASASGELVNSGVIEAATAELKAAGGNSYALAINNTGVIRATGTTERNGNVWLVGTGGDVSSSGTLAATNADGTVGGDVRVLGDKVTLGAGALVDVSGSQVGGTALIGGDYQGAEAGAPNASETILKAGSTVRADGAEQGGRIIVWSDGHTYFAGDLSATGATGGFVETSGHTFDLLGSVRAGIGGQWLIDPTDFTIDSTQAGIFAGSLSAGTNVDVTTSGGGSDAGDIFVNSTISIDMGSASAVHPTFSLIADGSIIFATGVELLAYNSTVGASPDSTLSVVLEAQNNIEFVEFNLWSAAHDINFSANAGQSITFYNGSALSTAGGSVSMIAGNGVDLDSGSIYTGGGNITLSSRSGQLRVSSSELNTQGGDFLLNTDVANDVGKVRIIASTLAAEAGSIGMGNVNGDSIIFYTGHLSAAGNITLVGKATGTDTNANNLAGITLRDGSTITSAGGAITLTGEGVAAVESAYGVYISGSSINGSAGGVTLNGTGEGYDTFGVRINLSSSVTATGGTLAVNGDASVTNNDYATGVWLQGSTLSNSGGDVTISGNASGTSGYSYMQGVQISSGSSVSASGDLTIDGDSATVAGVGNLGVTVGGSLSASGVNGVSIDGTGTNGSVILNGASIDASLLAVTSTKDITLQGSMGLALGDAGVERHVGWSFDADGAITLQDFTLNAYLPDGDNVDSGLLLSFDAVSGISFNNTSLWSAGHDLGVTAHATGGSISLDSTSVFSTAGGAVSLTASNGLVIEGDANVVDKGIFTGGGNLTLSAGTGQLRLAATSLMTGGGNLLLNTTGADTGKVRIIATAMDASTGGATIGNVNGDSIIFYDGHLTAGGTIALVGNATGTTTDADNHAGITIWSGSTITSTGGAITLNGTGTAAANSAYGILIDNATIVGSTGGVTLTGTGQGADSSGVQINHGGSVTATGGTILVDGKSTATAADQNNVYGVDVYGSSLTNTGGAITILGDATTTFTGFDTGFQNHGVLLDASSSLTAADTISITGTGGGRGAVEPPSDQRIGNFGVNLLANVTVTGDGDIIIDGTGGNGDQAQEAQNDGNFGAVISTGTVQTQGTGNITITGNAGPSTLAAYGHGVLVNNGATIQTAGGNLLVTADGRGYEGAGFVLRDGSILRTTGAGNLTINATTQSTSLQGYTIAARFSSGLLETENGNLSITGTNNSTESLSAGDTWAIGVNILPTVTLRTTGTGDISITGTGGNIDGVNNNHGVAIWGTVEATGTGDITITGTGGSGLSHGVYLGTAAQEAVFGGSVGATDAKVVASGGSVSITGTSNSTDANAFALFIDSGGSIFANGTDGLTLAGLGTNGSVDFRNVVTSGYDLTVTSTENIRFSGDVGLALGDANIERHPEWSFTAAGSITLQDILLNAYLPDGDNLDSNLVLTLGAGDNIDFLNTNLWSAGHAISVSATATNGSIQFDSVSSLRTAGGSVSLVAGNGVNIERNTDFSDKGIFTSGGDLTVSSGVGQLRIASSNLSTQGGNIFLNTDADNDTGKVRIIASYLDASAGNITIGNANPDGDSIIFYDGHLTAGGAITLVGKATGTTTDANNRAGITIWQGSTITSTGGAITLNGTGTAADNSAYGILIDNATITGASGGVSLTGTGEGGDSAGVQINHGSSVTATGGTILVDGKSTATAAGQNNVYGVDVYGSSLTNTGGGITIIGDATTTKIGFDTGFQNHGVYLDAGSSLTATDDISLTGTGGGRGAVVPPSDQRIGNFGVNLLANVTVTGNGNISITGTGGNGDQTQEAQNDGNFGAVISTGTVQTQGTGNITITGNAGPSTLAAYGHGVLVNAGATIQTAGGNLLVTANGRGYEGGGFVLRDESILRTTGAGNLTINATTESTIAQGYTIAARFSSGLLETENGNLTITGTNYSTADQSAGDTWAIGVNILPTVTLRTTGMGDISITGFGGNIPGLNSNLGVAIWGTVEATGTGDISITGTGGPGLSHGVYIGAAAQEAIFGVDVGATNAVVSTASGSVTITGTSDSADENAFSVFIDQGGSVSANGAVTLNAQGANGAASIGDVSTANHDLSVNAVSDITLTGALVAGTDARLTLDPGAGHTLTQQSGASIIAGTLDLRGAGTAHALINGSNQVSYLTANVGTLSFAGEGGFAIGLSSDVDLNGITATGPVYLAATGANGNLYLNSFISITSGADTTLDISTTRDLIVNQGSTIEVLGSNKGDITLTSNSLGDADGGSVYLLQGSTITTNNGNLVVGGGQQDGYALARPGENELPYGIWVATSTINTGAGNMTFRGIGENGVRFSGSSLTTTSGNILVDGRGADTGGTGVFIKSYFNDVNTPTTPVEFTTDSGSITLTGTANLTATGSGQNEWVGVNLWTDERDLLNPETHKGLLIQSASGDISIASVDSGSVKLGSGGRVVADSGDLAITSAGAIDVAGEVLSTSGDIIVKAGSGELALRSGASITAGGAGGINLVSGGTFNNQAGANVLTATGGRWLVWSQNPLEDVRGGLVYGFKQYVATYGVTDVAQSTGNGVLYAYAPTLTVGLTGSITKTYDGNTSTSTFSTDNLTVTNGLVDGDQMTLSFGGASYADKNAGSGIGVNVTGIGLGSASNGDAVVYGYQLANTTAAAGIGEISKKTLVISADDATRLTYTANPAFTASFDGLIDGETSDVVTGLQFGTLANLQSESGEYTITLSGADAANYALEYVEGTLTVVRPALEVDGQTVPVVQVNGDPVISDTHAVVLIGGRPTLVSLVDLNTGNSRSLEEDMGNAITAPPLFTYSFPQAFTPVSYRASVTGQSTSDLKTLVSTSFAEFLDTENAQ